MIILLIFVVGDINKMIKEIIKLANHLDSIGHKKEADAIDLILRKISLDVATPGSGGGGLTLMTLHLELSLQRLTKILMVCLNLKRN